MGKTSGFYITLNKAKDFLERVEGIKNKDSSLTIRDITFKDKNGFCETTWDKLVALSKGNLGEKASFNKRKFNAFEKNLEWYEKELKIDVESNKKQKIFINPSVDIELNIPKKMEENQNEVQNITIKDIDPEVCKKLLGFFKKIYADVTIPDPLRGFYDIEDEYLKTIIIELSHFQNEYIDHEDILKEIDVFMNLISKCEEGAPEDIKALLSESRKRVEILINQKLKGATNSRL
jgi:ferredoxin-fold anticodon binding domain-containing protein